MTSERWAELSKLYAASPDTFEADHLQAAVMAKTLAAQLAKYLGGPANSVLMYDFDDERETYTEEGDPRKAVTMNGEFKWYLGYGITLERAPTARPKTTFQFPIWFTLGEVLTVDTPFG